nr:hypothetical protein Itr_chr12CG24680 [Ipomoea trifida]
MILQVGELFFQLFPTSDASLHLIPELLRISFHNHLPVAFQIAIEPVYCGGQLTFNLSTSAVKRLIFSVSSTGTGVSWLFASSKSVCRKLITSVNGKER